MRRIDLIRKLEGEKVLTSELCPTPSYWHWNVLRPDLLPSELSDQYRYYGEIRWYGYEDL